MRLRFIITSISKNILLLCMPMEIKNHLYRPLLTNVDDCLFDGVNLREKIFVRFSPSPVQISTTERTTVVPMDNPIRVHHRKNFKYKISPQYAGLQVF